ncbi:MAG: hypothetical protein QNJ31_05240 [Candidatus Caenarcaniphilales bacterium]|nr:hypothetical protein [Candidatus Caenarcaniphilales bacterium]
MAQITEEKQNNQQLQENALLAYQEKSQELARAERNHRHELRIRGFMLKTAVLTGCIVVSTVIIFSLISLLIWGNESKWQTVYDSLLAMLSYIWTAIGAGAVGLIFGKKMKG